MRIFVNFSTEKDDIIELENRVANFHATLLVEKIKQLKINDSSKENILNSVLFDLEKNVQAKD